MTLREAAEALLQVWDTVGHTSKCGCDACDAMVEVRKALAQPSDEWREGWRAGVEVAAQEASAESHHVGPEDPTWQANARASLNIARRVRSLSPPEEKT